MTYRILGGAHEIGGNCVELTCDGYRLLLDLGRPLSAGRDDVVPLPDVAGLEKGDDSSLCGIVVSHGHMDHYGLLASAHPDVPVYMGRDAARILEAASFFIKNQYVPQLKGYLRDRQTIEIGPFCVTPMLVDHSAFDSYALLVQAGGKRLFYTGDLRAHGRKASLFERLIDHPPRDVDLLLSEATNVRDSVVPEGPVWTESELEERFVQAFNDAPGLAMTAFSAQNIDRLVTVYRAAKKANRTLVVDLYSATVAVATGSTSIPQPLEQGRRFNNYRVYVPVSQSGLVKDSKEFDRVDSIRNIRILREEIAAHPDRFVMLFRGAMMRDLRALSALGGLAGARAWWSLWRGYLEEPSGQRLINDLAALGVPLDVLHTSGHASVADLRRLQAAIAARETIFMHTSHPDAASVIL